MEIMIGALRRTFSLHIAVEVRHTQPPDVAPADMHEIIAQRERRHRALQAERDRWQDAARCHRPIT